MTAPRSCWVLALLLWPCAGCHAFVGNPDVRLNGDATWRDAPPTTLQRPNDATPRVWVRIRAVDTAGGRVRVLSSRVRQVLIEEGWQVVEDRDRASVWLDLNIRFWGRNPIRDHAVSTYAKVVLGMRPDVIAEGESVAGGEFGQWWFLTPVGATLSAMTANVVEFNLIVDTHLVRVGGEDERPTLVVWARRIDLTEQEAAVEISDQVLAALRKVF